MPGDSETLTITVSARQSGATNCALYGQSNHRGFRRASDAKSQSITVNLTVGSVSRPSRTSGQLTFR